MVSQFISSHNVNLLGDLDFDFPQGTHAIGRLDGDSEGLLLLTTNKKVTRLLFHGETSHKRIYLVQVNNIMDAENLERLRTGVTIRTKGGQQYLTPPCDVSIVNNTELANRFENDREGKFGKHTWLLISLTEGKFRQVRKMINSVHHRCKRLIRVAIEDILLDDLKPGAVKEITELDFFQKLKL